MTDGKTPEDAPAGEPSTEPSRPTGNRWLIATIVAVGVLILAAIVFAVIALSASRTSGAW